MRATDSMYNRLFSSHVEKQNKLDELIKRHKEEEALQNTFKPVIVTNPDQDLVKFQTIEVKVKSQSPMASRSAKRRAQGDDAGEL